MNKSEFPVCKKFANFSWGQETATIKQKVSAIRTMKDVKVFKEERVFFQVLGGRWK